MAPPDGSAWRMRSNSAMSDTPHPQNRPQDLPQAHPNDHRLDELEIKASYTEDLLDQLNLTIYRQQQQIDELARTIVQLRQQMPEAGGGAAVRNLRDELPPHY